MKRKLTGFLLLALVFAIFCGFSENQKVCDFADLLDASEESSLQAECIRVAKAIKCDVVILTVNDAKGKSAMEYADDFYDENGFGYDAPQGTGVLFLIDMDNREVWLSTCGDAIGYINDARIDLILDNLYGDIVAGEYEAACRSFLNDVEHYNTLSAPSSPSKGSSSYPQTYYYNEGVGFNPAIALIISVALAMIIVFGMVKGAGGRVTVGSSTYLNHSSVKIRSQYDRFINKSVSVRYIPPPTSGGGGFSSTHNSSGGISHGGGGRGF